jgi:hypothetical protein
MHIDILELLSKVQLVLLRVELLDQLQELVQEMQWNMALKMSLIGTDYDNQNQMNSVHKNA